MNAASSSTTDANGNSEARYLESFSVGDRWVSKPTVLTEAEMIAYGIANDPQPMHTDPEAAQAGPFGGLVASGWQIAALSMRVFVQSGGYGKTPVRPGDTLVVEREVVEVTRSESRPDRGMIRTRVNVRNQDDEIVMTLYTLGRVPARTDGTTPATDTGSKP
jgi:acyl dehydratase